MYRLNQIIRELEGCEPYKPFRFITRRERIINIISAWGLAFSGICFLLLLMLALWCQYNTPGLKVIWLATALYLFCTLSALVAMFIPSLYGLIKIFGWKKEAITELLLEIDHDEANAKKLSYYSKLELDYAKHWVQLKINRLLVRVSNVFGDKTALMALIGLAYGAIKGLGGPNNLLAMFSKGFYSVEGIVIQVLALLLGVSLGALMLKKMAGYYVYKLELIEAALKIEAIKSEEGAQS